MKCNETKQLLSEYVDDYLDETSRKRVADHLLSCENCRNELSALRLMTEKIGQVEPVSAPDDFLFQLNKRIQQESGFKKFLNILALPFRMKPSFQFATATAVAVLIIFVINIKQPEQPLYHAAQKRVTPVAVDSISAKKEQISIPISDKGKSDEKVIQMEQKQPMVMAEREPAPRVEQELSEHVMKQTAPEPTPAKEMPPFMPAVPVEKAMVAESKSSGSIEWTILLRPRTQPLATTSADASVEKRYGVMAAKSGAYDSDKKLDEKSRLWSEGSPSTKYSYENLSTDGNKATGQPEPKGQVLKEDADEMNQWVGIIEAAAEKYNGKMVSGEADAEIGKSGPSERIITIEMPVENQKAFYQELAHINQFQMPEEAMPEPSSKTSLIRVKLIQ